MIKKIFKYTNFEGVETVSEFRFHLSKIELAEKEILSDGEYRKGLMKVSASSQASEVYPILKEFILDSVGQVSEDGTYFQKSETIKQKFMQCGAYEMLIFEILQDSNAASEFMNGIMPPELVAEANALIASGKDPLSLATTPEGEAERKLESYTRSELLAMPQDQFDRLVGKNAAKMSHEHLMVAFARKTSGKFD